jgi:hypothetical protein
VRLASVPSGREAVIDIPLLLSGPILRRTEPARVCVWVATSTPARVRGEVFSFLGGRPLPIGAGSAETIRLGAKLFVHLVGMTPENGAFPRDELLAYDLELSDNGTTKRLADLDLLSGDDTIAYEGLPLPTFFLRDQIPELTILHGSCRELHGKREDAFAAGDELTARHARELNRRPCAIFLTGDQIYADDVAGPVINHATGLGDELLGWSQDDLIPDIPPLADIPVYGRQKLLKEKCGFTSHSAGNHLVSFGEFAAMYLMAWNEKIWPEDFPSAAEALQAPGPVPDSMHVRRRKYVSELKALKEARRSLPAVRRLLANVPTYMIFDDHEITDDWNLCKSWRDEVRNSPAGKRLVANGLAAYWAFEAWGNDPDAFDESFKKTISGYFARDGSVDGETFDRQMWTFDRWTYWAPTTPPAIVLDTRTKRGFDSRDGAARLINREGLEYVRDVAGRAGYDPGERLIIVSPVPVFGLELQERRQKLLANRVKAYRVDLEAWHSNLHGLLDFLDFVIEELKLTECIFLSGDVHYGMNLDVTFSKEDRELHALQLVSSALRHSGTSSGLALGLLGRMVGRKHDRVGWRKPPEVDTSNLKRRALRRPANTDAWDEGAPVFLRPQEVDRLGIKEAPEYRENKTYVEVSEGYESFIVGENNLGLVTVRGPEVTHRLLTRKQDEVLTFTAVLESSE